MCCLASHLQFVKSALSHFTNCGLYPLQVVCALSFLPLNAKVMTLMLLGKRELTAKLVPMDSGAHKLKLSEYTEQCTIRKKEKNFF